MTLINREFFVKQCHIVCAIFIFVQTTEDTFKNNASFPGKAMTKGLFRITTIKGKESLKNKKKK